MHNRQNLSEKQSLYQINAHHHGHMSSLEQQLIKFPTITKLQYLGEQAHQLQQTARSKFNYKTAYSKFGQIAAQANLQTNKGDHRERKEFKLVELPHEGDIMSICTMRIRESQGQVRKEEGEEGKEQGKVGGYLRKGKSMSTLTGVNFKSKTNISKFLTPSEHSHTPTKPPILKISKTLLPSKINIPELYVQIISALSLANGGISLSGDSTRSFQRIRRARVERGNNGYIVKQTVKKRLWWNAGGDGGSTGMDGFNLVWTENRLKEEKIGNGREVFYRKVEKEEKKKVVFQRNIDQALSFYPKMLQLFFTQDELDTLLDTSSLHKSKSLTSTSFSSSFSPSKSTLKTTLKPTKLHKIYKYISQELPPLLHIHPEHTAIFNHIPNNTEITSKKMLYKNVWEWCNNNGRDPHTLMPKTYHFTAFDWQEKIRFVYEQEEREKSRHAWFLKPGENSNRGRGISVYKNHREILDYIMRNPPKSISKSYLIQEYISPMLYESRKFDIRCFMLCIQCFGLQTFYWYEQGYIRTSSEKFTMNKTTPEIHLTNDAIQKGFDNYDKYESANKLSYMDLDRYLRNENGVQFFRDVLPKIRGIAKDVCLAAEGLGIEGWRGSQQKEASPSGKEKGIYFELFGLDYILDDKGIPFLLQVNTNPCLEINSNLLSRIIPEVIENTFRVVLDVFMPCIKSGSIVAPDWAENFILNNKYSLLYRKRKYDPFFEEKENDPNPKNAKDKEDADFNVDVHEKAIVLIKEQQAEKEEDSRREKYAKQSQGHLMEEEEEEVGRDQSHNEKGRKIEEGDKKIAIEEG